MREKILQKIQSRAEASLSDVIYITQNGQVLLDWAAEANLPPLEIMSIGKSIVALAIGILIDEGKIPHIDTPIHTFYPEWRQGQKEKVTLRMIMNHTSGLQTIPDGDEITRAPNCIQLALCAELSHAPGTQFFYNNKAVNILSGIIQKVTNQLLEKFVQARIFAPLKIQEFGWKRDSQGNSYALGGVQMHAKDVHKIGELVMNRGRWSDEVIVSEVWLNQMLTPSIESNHACGLLWWIYENPKIYAAQGYLGQWLYIMPEKKLIALRQLRKGKTDLNQVDEYKDFRELVIELASV